MFRPESNKKREAGIFHKVSKGINVASDFTAGTITITLLIVVLIQVIGRLLEQSSPWTEELTRYVFIWMIFLGVALGFRKDESPRITFFVNKLPRKVQKVISLLTIIITFAFFIFLFFTGINLMGQQMNETSPVLRITVAWIGLCIPLCACLSMFNFTQYILSSTKKEESKEEE
ncbi:TRAP transporter small permease [Salibacterium salarium]|uniref:TRAP transporter small permease n=1 Tax=Salibacterium salarium TaxID=284579 RepID=A0A3R9WQI7_9BACI|nr:TRAP transporter small permease [Salibacterium salarium]RSL31452.1 TRAP transporter small permease [Salibacterium salarium]